MKIKYIHNKKKMLSSRQLRYRFRNFGTLGKNILCIKLYKDSPFLGVWEESIKINIKILKEIIQEINTSSLPSQERIVNWLTRFIYSEHLTEEFIKTCKKTYELSPTYEDIKKVIPQVLLSYQQLIEQLYGELK